LSTRLDGTPTAYFRGRKLQGKSVKLPEGYRGVVAAVSEAEKPATEAEVIDLEAEAPQGSLQVQAEFDEMLVWGHESTVDASADPYMRGVEEWLALSDTV
jgi:ribonuclease H2 subunit C